MTTKTWGMGRRCFGRIQVMVTVHRHTYPTASDRWVLQPTFIYDRKGKR